MKLPIHKSTLIKQLLKQEDTTGSGTITVDDKGIGVFKLKNEKGEEITISGTFHLSNLLQEAALMEEEEGFILLENIKEEPSDRLLRVIKQYYWEKLTRRIDANGLEKVLLDEKMKGDKLRLYVPETDAKAIDFYSRLLKEHKFVSMEIVPQNLSREYIANLNKNPGILSLAFNSEKNESVPFVVSGGRFNEMYGWDSYFIGLGLIIDREFELAKGMIDNLEYQIIHYGKILNANRSYYLSRSHPPFFTSFVRSFYETFSENISKEWLRKKVITAITEYRNVWMRPNIRLTKTQLNRYFGEGSGIPEETEPGHFNFILKKFAVKHGLPLSEFAERYSNSEIKDEMLDQYFVHDRSMRESGHDTTIRLDAVSASLNTVDLNSLLYKYETDIAYFIKNIFNDSLEVDNKKMTSENWFKKAEERNINMQKILWKEQDGSFYDYNFQTKQVQKTVSATNFYPLWAKLCTQEQAANMVKNQLPKLLCKGGIASTAKVAPNEIETAAPGRQWDFPYGWAPHQIIVWQGLINYGFVEKAQELIYRWLWLITKTATNYNGIIPEKFNVEKASHQTHVEYGNVGVEFKHVTDGGFGWTNASYKLGMTLLDKKHVPALNSLKDPDIIFG